MRGGLFAIAELLAFMASIDEYVEENRTEDNLIVRNGKT